MNKERLVIYFGTTAVNSGHHLRILCGSMSDLDKNMLSIHLDSSEYLEIRMLANKEYFICIHSLGYTILCCPYSLHDCRPGSKTMFGIKGYISMDEIKTELSRRFEIRDVFNVIEYKYKIKGFKEII